MKMGIGSAKPHRSVFHLFARYYDAEEVIHKRISSNWQYISNSGPKAMPKTIKNWTFNETVHRIRKTSQSRFSLFCKILRCWSSDSSAHFLKFEKISQTLAPKLCQKLWKIELFELLMRRCYRIRKLWPPHRKASVQQILKEPFFAFLQDITMLKKWFISAFPQIEKISHPLAPKLCQKL